MPNRNSRDVVFTFFMESWKNAVGREMYMAGPRLLATLMSEPSIERLLVANPFRSTPIQWARRIMGQGPPPFPGDGCHALVEPRQIRRRDPTSVRALERAYAAYDRTLEAAAADLGANRPVIITTNPLVAGFSPLRWADQVTFYAWDDWPAALALHRWWSAYDEAYARIRELGRAVVGVSQAVVDRIQPTGANAVVPNGVAPEEWLQPDAPPTWFTELPQPRILYAGAMTRERLSVETLSEIATRFAHGSLVLVGPILDRGMLVPLLRCPNVWVHSEVGRTEVASIIHSADVCIMPHRFNPLTMAMSPIKIYEYLAAGRPVAASDLPPVRVIDPRIVYVPEGHSFADGVEKALRRGPFSEIERQAFIHANSWSRRHEQILGVAFGPAEGSQNETP